MALNGTVAGDAVYAALQALPSSSKTNPQAVWEAIMTAIYADIKANAVVPSGITVQVAPPSGTGATTGPGTIT